jgi:hypothetical protein
VALNTRALSKGEGGRGSGVAQVVEHLSCKSEALSSNPSTAQREHGGEEGGLG